MFINTLLSANLAASKIVKFVMIMQHAQHVYLILICKIINAYNIADLDFMELEIFFKEEHVKIVLKIV